MKIDVKINLEKIACNIRQYNKKVILMVKGDGYGHGIVEVSKYVESIVYGLGVATIEEGIVLRENGIRGQVLVCQCLPQEIGKALEYNLSPTIGCFEGLSSIDEDLDKIVVKINTGMNRFGFDLDDLPHVETMLKGRKVQGVYSHIYSLSSAREQESNFQKALSHFDRACQRHVYATSTAHLGNDIVRVGMGAYEGAMTVESRVVAVRRLRKGDNVGYGQTMPDDGNVAWIFGGYADGINRERPQPVLIEGQICPTIAVCMDTICVYTGEMQCKIGDRVVLQNETLTPQYIAENTSTISYTILTGRNGRINRIYTK